MKILVTGGAGFIGSHIVDAYIEKGDDVIVVDNLSTGKAENVNKKAKFINADIRDYDKIYRIFSEEKPQVLNHHAAQIDVRKSVNEPLFDAEINILGCLNLFEAGRINGLKRAIFASSGGAIYGDNVKIPTPENIMSYNPLSPYGINKLTCEYYLSYYRKQYGIKSVSLRYSNVYGPRQNPFGEAGVISIFINRILKDKKPVIYGDGLQTRDYIYVGDVIKANLYALEEKNSGTFNISTGIETNVIELFKRIAKLMNSKISPEFGPARPGEQKRSCLEWRKANKQMSWRPEFNLEKGLRNTIKYYLPFQE